MFPSEAAWERERETPVILIDIDRKDLRSQTASRKQTDSRRLRGGEEIKAEGLSKGGWETMECDGQRRGIRGTSIASQALLPGKTPMRTPGSAQDFFSGWGDWR